MRQKFISTSVLLLIIFTLITTSYLYLLTPPEAISESVGDYFNISYAVTFNKTNILRDESFSVTMHGNATCTNNLPPISRGRIIGCVIAKNISSGHQIIINSEYTLTIDPFPHHKGDSTEITVTVPLQFPAYDIPGDYSIVGETIKAEGFTLGEWKDVTEYMPASHVLGSVHYATSGTTSTPTPTPTHTSIASITPAPGATASPAATATSNATTSSTVTATPGASVTPAVSPGATATTTAAATTVPTGTTTADASSLTPDGSTTPAHYGAPIWAAIGLIVVLILAIIILAIVRLQTRLKHAVQSDENLPEDIKNKQV